MAIQPPNKSLQQLTYRLDGEKGKGNETMTNGKSRTLVFQINEELFQRIKTHLERESARLGRNYTQREFVIGLIEQVLAEAEPDTQNSTDMAPVSPGETPEEPDEDEGQPEDKGRC